MAPQQQFFRSFVGVLLENVLSDDLGDAFGPFSATGYPGSDKPTAAGTNIQTGMKAVIESLSGRGEYDLLNGEKTSTVMCNRFPRRSTCWRQSRAVM